MITITSGKTSRRAIRFTVENEPSVTEKKPRMAVPMYAPSVNTSPCAKLISSMMP